MNPQEFIYLVKKYFGKLRRFVTVVLVKVT